MPQPNSDRVQQADIAKFYNHFNDHLVKGFVKGNLRVDHAVRFAQSQLPKNAKSMLEIGCGVGETTKRIWQHRPDLAATGVDISEQNIRVARQLFADSCPAEFHVSDLTSPVAGGPFDVVTLLDVYEHIPILERPRFHQNVKRSMAKDSRLILTCPSFLHQRHLHDHEPEGLQIVDETIGPNEFVQLANDLDAQLVHLSYESVWRTNDYVYAVIDTAMKYEWKEAQRSPSKLSRKINKAINKTPLSRTYRRKKFVHRRLAS